MVNFSSLIGKGKAACDMEKIILSAKQFMEQEGTYELHNEFINQEDFDCFVLFTKERKGSPSFRDPLYGFTFTSHGPFPFSVSIAHHQGEKVYITVGEII